MTLADEWVINDRACYCFTYDATRGFAKFGLNIFTRGNYFANVHATKLVACS